MSTLATGVLVGCLIVSLCLSLFHFSRSHNGKLLAFQLIAMALLVLTLKFSFGFPEISASAKGPLDPAEFLPVVGLFAAMVIGMFAQSLHDRLSRPRETRPIFDLGVFLAPIFVSPIVFIPVFETLKTASFDSSAGLMALLVAFENGFFFKNYMDGRHEAHANKVDP